MNEKEIREDTPIENVENAQEIIEPEIIIFLRKQKQHQGELGRIIQKDPTALTAVDPKHIDNPTALHIVVTKGLKKYVGTLMDANADTNAPDKRQYTPLHCAVVTSHDTTLEIINILLNHKANPLLQNDLHKTPIDLIFGRCSLEKKDLLVMTDDFHKTQLILSLKLDILKLFVNRFKNLVQAYADFEGKTLLHLAVLGTECQKNEIIAYLLKKGADPNKKDKQGRSANDIYQKKYNRDISEIISEQSHTKIEKEEDYYEKVYEQAKQKGAERPKKKPRTEESTISNVDTFTILRSLLSGTFKPQQAPTNSVTPLVDNPVSLFPSNEDTLVSTDSKEEEAKKEASKEEASEEEASEEEASEEEASSEPEEQLSNKFIKGVQ